MTEEVGGDIEDKRGRETQRRWGRESKTGEPGRSREAERKKDRIQRETDRQGRGNILGSRTLHFLLRGPHVLRPSKASSNTGFLPLQTLYPSLPPPMEES